MAWPKVKIATEVPKAKVFSKEEMVKILNEAVAEQERAEKRAHEEKWGTQVVGRCVACRGKLLSVAHAEQNGPMIIGPGNRSFAVREIHCDNCGIKYEHPPKPKRRTRG